MRLAQATILLLPLTLLLPRVCAADGPLFIVGGGSISDDILRAAMGAAGGTKANIVILPQASSREDRGESAASEFRRLGATKVHVLELDDAEAAERQIAEADFIWFPGGQQSQLVTSLDEAGVCDSIRKRHRAGAVIGGTSAGAAAMSAVMIPTMPDQPALRARNTPITKGLGLAPELIVDQHFVERQRFNRLLSAVLDHPDCVGVGIGEGTAVVKHEKSIKVMGSGSVVIVDARRAEAPQADAGELQQARQVQLHVLKAGDRFTY